MFGQQPLAVWSIAADYLVSDHYPGVRSVCNIGPWPNVRTVYVPGCYKCPGRVAILYVISPAFVSSEFGIYIHVLDDEEKIIYSYHVKDKTISFSSIPCVAGTNHVSAWAMLECTRLESDRVLVGCKQEKEGHKEDEIVVRSVKANHEVDSQLLNFRNDLLKEFCVGVKCLKLSPLPYIEYECMLKSDETDDDELHLFNLPPHVLENLVMEFCAGVDYLKFRAICKRCHLAAPLVPWNNRKASKIMQNYSLPSPCLLVFDKYKGIMTLTDPMFGDKYFMKTPQEFICNFQIKCSRFGWLLILKPDGSLVFFNPFTNDILELPELPDKHIDTVVNHPGVVLFSIFEVMYFTSITFYGRDLYALMEDGGFDVFSQMGRENHKWWYDEAKAPASCCSSLPECFHLKCDHHNLRVIVGKFGESVEAADRVVNLTPGFAITISEIANEFAIKGNLVYRSNDASHAAAGGKLGPKWEGPYEVTDALGNRAYKLRSMDGTILPKTWNVANLKRCYL
nr:hypothetical protein [Tanacetum cinerariifolium]